MSLSQVESAFEQAIAAVRGANDATQEKGSGAVSSGDGLQQDVMSREADLSWLRSELANLQMMIKTGVKPAGSGSSDPASEPTSKLSAEHNSLLAEAEMLKSLEASSGSSSRDPGVRTLEERILDLQIRVAELKVRLSQSVRSV
ncbi:hypothetical protein [Salinarimonas soli]|uniref:Uncharacterized protein n=1 Tax=Salinarimonas soli TaxID=1638099 RepID=A0A5B2VQJ4_9HYPH|nr:hypothetical protein [Salinarimonas soli]KAA2241034.1 hypothetical protein F0L46_05195 [Salinarimonas soli]